MKRKEVLGESLRFVLVGTAATALHYGTYWVLRTCVPLNVAYTLGYLLGFVFNFFFTARFTFGSRPSWVRLWGMAGANVVNYLLHMVLLNVVLWFGVPSGWAPLPVFAIAVPVNFVLVRWVFKHKSRS
ncbi:MAG: GtrA family protein [Alloprevotella sp.]